jgi:hypothetical protein
VLLILPSISTTEDWCSACHPWLHLSDVRFFPHHTPSRLPANYEHQLCLLNLNVDSSSLDEVLHIPNTLVVHGGCPQTSLFLDLPIYHCLAYLDCWSENIFWEISLLCSDKELVGSLLLLVNSILFLVLPSFGKLCPLFLL